jgi:hypothetical protein
MFYNSNIAVRGFKTAAMAAVVSQKSGKLLSAGRAPRPVCAAIRLPVFFSFLARFGAAEAGSLSDIRSENRAISEHKGRGPGALMKFFLVALCVLAVNIWVAVGQSEGPNENRRIELGNVQLIKQSKKRISLRVDVLNTGRLAVLLHPLRDDFEFLYGIKNLPVGVLEQDVLLGLKNKKLSIEPGQKITNVVLKLPRLSTQPQLQTENIEPSGCADLVFDTVYLVKQTRKEAVLNMVVSNQGMHLHRLRV